MMTPRENLVEVMKGSKGNPERFANQYEAFGIVMTPYMAHWNYPDPGEVNKVNWWGVTLSWEPGQPGSFPVHTPDKIVIKDFEDWQEYVKAPPTKFSDAEWDAMCGPQLDAIDRKSQYVTPMVAPGLFEQSHNLGEIANTLAAFYEYPDELKELYKYLMEWEIQLAEDICDHIHPDGMFHHDDWGSQKSTFVSPAMFEEFLVPFYEELYGYWHERGVEVIVHHSDSYAETLVPYMIDMGINVWQGVMTTNDIPAMLKQYDGKITFMGGINSASIDFEGSTRDIVWDEVKRACDEYGPHGMIIGASQGLAISTFPGVYDWTTECINEYSPIYFKEHGLA